jgi:hypothetical protein
MFIRVIGAHDEVIALDVARPVSTWLGWVGPYSLQSRNSCTYCVGFEVLTAYYILGTR